MIEDTSPILIEQVCPAPIPTVWQAITSKDQMCQWLFDTISDFRPELGFETQFNVHAGEKDYLHIWKVTEVIPEKRIAYEWRYGGYDGNSTVEWELSEVPEGTKLAFAHVGHETLRGDELFSRENGVAGWTYLIRESLQEFLSGQG